MYLRAAATYLIGISILSSAVSGQPELVEEENCVPEYAKFLAEQSTVESQSVRENDKRTRILLRAADFLWVLDEASARRSFADAFRLAANEYSESSARASKSSPGVMRQGAVDLRFDVLAAIAKRDPTWARKLTDELLAEFEKNAASRNEIDSQREINQILNIAVERIDVDPQLSWHLFRRVMKYPLDFHWWSTLVSVASKDPAASSALYLELIQNYKNESFRRLLLLSAFPFASDRILGADKYQYGIGETSSHVSDPRLQRVFIDALFTRIATLAADPETRLRPREGYRLPEAAYMVSALRDLEPIILQDFPDLAPRFSSARSQAVSLMTDETKNLLDQRGQQTKNLGQSFEERLNAIEEADKLGTLNDMMIVNLITWGKKTEEQFKKLEPWLDKLKEESVRKDATEYFWYLRISLAIDEERFQYAESNFDEIGDPELIAVLSFRIAEKQLKNPHDAASAYSILSGVARRARGMGESQLKARVLLGTANLYGELNTGFALDELAEAVRVINRLENPDLSSTAVYREIKGKNFSFYTVFSVPGYSLEGTMKKLGQKSFGLTLSNAKALDDKFFRTIAVLATASRCAEAPAKNRPVTP